MIDVNGEQVGILSLREALRLAEERGLDLVEVAPMAKPPVCRVMDFGKYKYELSKREREARKKQHVVSIKEVKMRLAIDDNDFEVKAKNAQRFLADGDRVKVTVMFRGREIVHSDLGRRLLERLADMVKDLGTVERAPRIEGKNMVMVLAPKQVAAEKGDKGDDKRGGDA